MNAPSSLILLSLDSLPEILLVGGALAAATILSAMWFPRLVHACQQAMTLHGRQRPDPRAACGKSVQRASGVLYTTSESNPPKKAASKRRPGTGPLGYFGLVSLMSSVLIFNTLFPVDASTVSMLNRFASHSVAVLKELNMHGAVVSRRPPALIWVRGPTAPQPAAPWG